MQKVALKTKSSNGRTQTGVFYLMLLPFTIIITLFTIIPAIGAVLVSFTDFNGMTFPAFVGLDNYVRLMIEDTTFLVVLKNTLLIAVIVGPVGFILSFVLAWLINELPKNIRLLVIFLVYSPSFSGTLYTVWQYVFSNDDNGVVNSALLRMVWSR